MLRQFLMNPDFLKENQAVLTEDFILHIPMYLDILYVLLSNCTRIANTHTCLFLLSTVLQVKCFTEIKCQIYIEEMAG